MLKVLLAGTSLEESRRTESALSAADPGLDILTVTDSSLPTQFERGQTVGVILGTRPAEITPLVDEARDLGLPVVAVLKEVSTAGLNPARGYVDFCFAPFTPEELAERVRIVASRAAGPSSGNVISQGEIMIDMDRYEVTVDGRKVDLTFKEYELLRVLAANPGRVYSREGLLRTVWGYDYFGGTRTVDVHVRRLRSKINDVEHRFIETVWNVGYRFKPPADD